MSSYIGAYPSFLQMSLHLVQSLQWLSESWSSLYCYCLCLREPLRALLACYLGSLSCFTLLVHSVESQIVLFSSVSGPLPRSFLSVLSAGNSPVGWLDKLWQVGEWLGVCPTVKS